KSIPPTLKYEPGMIVAEKDFVIVHGRFSGIGQPVNWIAADVLRIKDGILIEHWDVIQDEATQEQSKSGRPMFGDEFPKRKRNLTVEKNEKAVKQIESSAMPGALEYFALTRPGNLLAWWSVPFGSHEEVGRP